VARRTIQFLTRPGCGMCDAALPRVRRVAGWLRRGVVVNDITGTPELEAQYHLRIPVLLDDAGAVIAEGELTTRQIISAALRMRGRR
jgi:hypothetical protein